MSMGLVWFRVKEMRFKNNCVWGALMFKIFVIYPGQTTSLVALLYLVAQYSRCSLLSILCL